MHMKFERGHRLYAHGISCDPGTQSLRVCCALSNSGRSAAAAVMHMDLPGGPPVRGTRCVVFGLSLGAEMMGADSYIRGLGTGHGTRSREGGKREGAHPRQTDS